MACINKVILLVFMILLVILKPGNGATCNSCQVPGQYCGSGIGDCCPGSSCTTPYGVCKSTSCLDAGAVCADGGGKLCCAGTACTLVDLTLGTAKCAVNCVTGDRCLGALRPCCPGYTCEPSSFTCRKNCLDAGAECGESEGSCCPGTTCV